MQNLFDLTGDNKIIDIVVDILLIFGAGSTLLFFANVIKNENKNLMIYMAVVVIFVNTVNIMYVHKYTSTNERVNTTYNAVMYLNVYLVILTILVAYMTQTNYY